MEIFLIILGIVIFLVLRFIFIRNNKLTTQVDDYGGMRAKYSQLLNRASIRIMDERRDYIHFQYTYDGFIFIGQIAEGTRVIMDIRTIGLDVEIIDTKSFTVASGADPKSLIQAFDQYVFEHTN